ncbi:hypothetical protein ABBQ32_14177 [Trebouxia sp. C0010 RCD-2024]
MHIVWLTHVPVLSEHRQTSKFISECRGDPACKCMQRSIYVSLQAHPASAGAPLRTIPSMSVLYSALMDVNVHLNQADHMQNFLLLKSQPNTQQTQASKLKLVR